MPQYLIEHMAEVAAFGTVAIVVLAPVAHRLHRPGKHIPGFFDLRTNLGQIRQFERGAVFLNEVTKRDPVEQQVAIFQIKAFLREVEGLIDEVKVSVGCSQCF
jgi:hypothetical protein